MLRLPMTGVIRWGGPGPGRNRSAPVAETRHGRDGPAKRPASGSVRSWRPPMVRGHQCDRCRSAQEDGVDRALTLIGPSD